MSTVPALPGSIAQCLAALAAMPLAPGAGWTTIPCAPTLIHTWLARCKARFVKSGSVPSAACDAACVVSVSPTSTASTLPAALQPELLLQRTLLDLALLMTCHLLPSKLVEFAPCAMFLQLLVPFEEEPFHMPWPMLPIAMMSVLGENS